MPSGMQAIIMLPHIIIIGMPIFIMPFIVSQACIIISLDVPAIGIMVHIILSPAISHFMVQVIIGIIIGIMPFIIIGFIMGICGIIGICIWGIIVVSWLGSGASPSRPGAVVDWLPEDVSAAVAGFNPTR
jgi:hypothetical protein